VSRKPRNPIFQQNGGCGGHLARPGELGCFNLNQKIAQKPVEGPRFENCYLHPNFTKYTPLPFFGDFFRNVTKLYEFRNDICFLSVMLRNLADYIVIPFLTYGMLRNLANCATMLPFWFPVCHGTLRIVHQYFLLIFDMSRNFTNCLMMGAKHLKMTKHKLHATKQRSPDEIRVWQIETIIQLHLAPMVGCLLISQMLHVCMHLELYPLHVS